MQRKDFISLNQIFSEGHKVLVRGILLFGAFSLMLAGLVFIFPTFIGVLVAIFLLLTGLITLIAGFHFWQLEKEKNRDEKPFDPKFESDTIRHRNPHYHFQTIRIMRW